MSGLEQFDGEVARGVGEQDLTPTRTRDHVAAKRQSGGAQPVDLGVQVTDDQMDAVAAGG